MIEDTKITNLSTMSAELSGTLPRHPRVPSTFGIGVEFEPAFIEGCKALTARFNALGGLKGKKDKVPDAIVVAAFEANSGMVCPGFLGSQRPLVEERLTRLFGTDGWRTEHKVSGRLVPERAALRLYEEGYVEHLRKNPEVLRWLCDNFSDVYDTGPSNVQSGFDYSIQELPKHGRHLHDIAIRKAVRTLGEKFRGDRLLQVRGPRSEGFCLSPGEVPFHRKEMIPDVQVPGGQPWWKVGTIEDFYQRTRRIVVPEFLDASHPTENVGRAQERTETYCARIASRFLLRMLPILTASDVEHGQLNDLPWMIDSHSCPTDTTGLPRPFTTQEEHFVARALHEQLVQLCGKSTNQECLLDKNPWLAFKKSQQFVGILDKIAQGGEPTAEEHQSFPDFSDMRVWSKALPYFWNHTFGEGRRPLHLARDGWIPMEYLSYRAELSGGDRQSPKRSVYIPGTSIRATQKKNNRGNCADLERVVERLTAFAVEAMDEHFKTGEVKSIRELFIDRVRMWIDPGVVGEEGSVWRPLYEQLMAQFPEDLSRIVVVDSDGTGKSAQFIATLLEQFGRAEGPALSVDVLLGGMKGTADSPALGVPNIAQMYDLPSDKTSGRHLPDARWPFSFDRYEPKPYFLVEKRPSRFLVLLWRSIQLYNQAVRDTYPPMEH